MEDWRKDTIARLLHERTKFATLAATKRREAIELRKRRDFLGALQADGRAREYRWSRDDRAAAVKRLRVGGQL